MTYQTSYKRCKTEEEFVDEVKKDVMAAMFLNDDIRLKNIREAAEYVANLRGWISPAQNEDKEGKYEQWRNNI